MKQTPQISRGRRALDLDTRAGWAGALLSTLLCVWGSPVQAQTSLTGSWRAGATAIEVSIESWGTDCGARPASTHSSGGGVVNVEQQGQVLLLHGRDQDIRTDACWSRNPAMKRSAASYSDGLWMTRCRTVADDPRAELGIYTLTLQDENTLLYKDVSHYDWALNESKCVATFTTTQTLTRAGASKPSEPNDKENAAAKPEQSPASSREAQPEPSSEQPTRESRGCRPGAAATIALRPKQAEVEVGERVCFKARVSDATDCPLPGAAVSWQLSHPKGLRATLSGGCFTAADSAAEAQGEFHVIAKSAGLQTEAVVVVKRMDLSALIARRMEGTGLTGLEETPEEVDPGPKAVARISTHTAPAATSNSRSGWTTLLGVLALGLIAAGYWMSRQKPAAKKRAVQSDDTPVKSVKSPESDAPTKQAQPAGPYICPTCRIGYPAEKQTCPKDGTALIPYAEFTAKQKREQSSQGKRCPKCGKNYPANAGFCGDDGSHLVDQA